MLGTALMRLIHAKTLCTLAAMTALTGPAFAHHAGNAFDMSRSETISGTVSQWLWTNPHTWIYLSVPTAAGDVEYRFEGMAISILARTGWTSKSLKAGDKISVSFAPYKDERKGGEYRTVTTADGTRLGQAGGL